MIDPQLTTTSRVRIAPLRFGYVVALALASIVCAPRSAAAQVNLVRMNGILGTQSAPGSAGQVTLAIGGKSVPFSVLSAQRISGDPAMAPEILSALGPGPPPIRVQGRRAMTTKLTGAPSGTKVTITGNLNAGTPLWVLMEVTVDKSAGAK